MANELTWANSDARKQTSKENDRFRLVAGTNFLSPPASEDPEDWANRPHLAIPLLDLILNGLTRLYVFGNGPTRTLEFAEGTRDDIVSLWKDYLGENPPKTPDDESVPYNVYMRQLHEEVLFHGTILVKMHSRAVVDAPVQLPSIPLIFRPWQYDVVLDPRDPRKFLAVKVLVNSTKYEVTNQSTPDDQIWEVWTPGQVWDENNKGEKSNARPNPYGMLPFLRVCSDPTYYDFWCPCLADFIVDICKVMHGLDTEQVDLMYWLFGQPMVDGALAESKDKEVFLGKGVLVHTDNGGKFSRAAPNVQMQDFLSSIDSLLFRIALSVGLSPAMFLRKTWEARDPSGTALREAETGPLDSRESSIDAMTRVEQRHAILFATVEATHRKEDPALWMPSSYRLNFPSVTARAKTPQDLREDNRLALDQKLKEKWQVAQEIDPHLTEAQARAQVEAAEGTSTIQEIVSGNNA